MALSPSNLRNRVIIDPLSPALIDLFTRTEQDTPGFFSRLLNTGASTGLEIFLRNILTKGTNKTRTDIDPITAAIFAARGIRF